MMGSRDRSEYQTQDKTDRTLPSIRSLLEADGSPVLFPQLQTSPPQWEPSPFTSPGLSTFRTQTSRQFYQERAQSNDDLGNLDDTETSPQVSQRRRSFTPSSSSDAKRKKPLDNKHMLKERPDRKIVGEEFRTL